MRKTELILYMSDQFKLSQEEKLMLIEELLQELSHGRSNLQVIQSDDALQGKPPTSVSVHTYQILGSDQMRRTQTSNLMMKVEEANRQKAPMDVEQDEQILEADKDRQIFRYFKSNIRCFRCKKVGHHNYACLDQNCCFFCLSATHSSDRCPQRTVCYQCYQWGHVISECVVGGGGFCQECKRKHSRVCCFLTKGIEPIKQMYNTDYLYNSENIRCMRCYEYGHLYCAPQVARYSNDPNS